MKQKRTGNNNNQTDENPNIWKSLKWSPVFLLIFLLVAEDRALHPITSRSDIISDYPVYPVVDTKKIERPGELPL